MCDLTTNTYFQHFVKPEWHLPIFITNYIAMLPAAHLLGFAGQELSRKIPQKAIAMVLETTFGSVVEIILFMVLLKQSNGNSNIFIIQAAILGSILANLLLCLGVCFIAGGLKHNTQEFHEAVSENGTGLMLVAASKCLFTFVPATSPGFGTMWLTVTLSGSRSACCLLQLSLQQSHLCFHSRDDCP